MDEDIYLYILSNKKKKSFDTYYIIYTFIFYDFWLLVKNWIPC